MNEGMENLKELEKLELIIKKFKQLVTEKESEVAALKQQLHTERESLKKEADKLMMDKIVYYEKEIDLVREEAQITQLQLEKKIRQKDDRIKELEQINKEHQTLNGKLREEIKSIEIETVNNFRRKGVL